ncbi:MAG: TonB-dependent receptor [Prolixibacteraceae bacterium]|nr:TonB-dependent receptor [Prolixibacteraceae bacterium]
MKKKRIGAPVPIRALSKLWKIMRLSVFFLVLFVAQTFATATYSQQTRLTFKMQGAKVIDVLNKIEDQSEFYFLFNQKLVDVERPVSVEVKNESIEKILTKLFENTNVSYMVKDRQIILTTANPESMVSEQQKTVSGKVSDASGIALPGVSVVIKGTTNGTITDTNGNYSLSNVPENATLQFSFVGMKGQEELVAGKSTINLKMEEDAIGIEEVVAIGYGTMKKSDLTGSVTRAKIEDFQESPNVSLTQSLQGVVPGLNVGQVTSAGEDASITVRGRNTISGTTSPLIVLDGIIYRGSLIDINPNDIESIDILKDASATAIYGSQASNGVMIISSKKGKDMGKPIVSYSGSYSYQMPSNTVKLGGTTEYINKVKTIFLNQAYLAPDYIKENPAFNVSTYLADKNSVDGYANGIDTDWWDLLTNDYGTIQDHTLSIRGKSNLSSYFISVGYLDQANILINDEYSRYNVRINMENDVTSWMKLGVQTFMTNSNYSGATANMSDVQNIVPNVPVYNANGELIQYPYKTWVNPLIKIQQDNLDKRMNLFGTFYTDINIPFIKGLNFRANFSQNLRTTRQYNYDKTIPNFQGTANKTNNYGYDWTFDNILTYKQNFGKHGVSTTLVYGIESREGEGTSATAQIFMNDALGYNGLEAGQADQRLLSSTAWEEKSLYSMGRLHYSYSNKYLFTGTIRRDAFSGFGANNKVGYFPSMALGWVVSEESFLKGNVSWLDQLKLRYSYGTNGNRTVGRYATLAKLSSAVRYLYGDGGTAEMSQWITSLANSNLKWEKTTTSNLGVDFAALNFRISGSIDAYLGNTVDLLYNIDIPVVNGFGSVPVNIGKMQNRGLELTFNGTPVKSKDLQWDVTLNFSINRNKVVSINGTDTNKDGIEDDIISGQGNSIFMGKPYGVWYDYNIIGMWQIEDGANIPAGFTFGTYKVNDISGPNGTPDGAWTAAYDRKIVGYKDPSYRFSVQNSLNYKNFELKAFLNSIQGGKNYYKAVAAGNWANIDNLKQQNSAEWDWWTPENTDAKYRRLGDYPKPIGENVHPYSSRSFVRLQDVSLSYQFNSSFLSKYGFRNCKLYVSGKNLKTWSNWEGWDPETGAALNPGGVPVMKSYSLGLNVEF